MKKIVFLMILLLIMPTFAFAGVDKGRRLTGNDKVISSRETLGAVTALQLSAGTSVPITSITICASNDNAGVVVWGGSNIVAATGPGCPLINPSCETVYVNNLNDIYVAAAVGDQVSYNYFQ